MPKKTSPAMKMNQKSMHMIRYVRMNAFCSICMCQKEWKGGEQKMRKYEMKHKVTEKSGTSGRKKQAGKRLSCR